MLQCVILAGGLGTRMRAFSGQTPKALIPVHGKPFLKYQLEWLARTGVTHVTFSIGHLGEQIENYAKDFPTPGLTLDFIYERGELLGTGGALRNVLDHDKLQETFTVLYGDSYLPIDVGQVATNFTAQKLPALMTVFKNHGQFDKSNAQYKHGKVIYYCKSPTQPVEYIDYGLSVLKRELIASHFPAGKKADLAGLYEQLSVDGQLAGFEVSERFYEIGSPQGLKEFSDYAQSHLTAN